MGIAIPVVPSNVPFRLEWLKGVYLLKDNAPTCLYTRQKPTDSYRIGSIRDEIENIRRLLNE